MATLESPVRAPFSTASYYTTVTPSDSTDFAAGVCGALYVGGAGNVAVVRPDGTAVTFPAVAGGYLFVCARRVNFANTSATGIIALYW